jgi:hypothetical protein
MFIASGQPLRIWLQRSQISRPRDRAPLERKAACRRICYRDLTPNGAKYPPPRLSGVRERKPKLFWGLKICNFRAGLESLRHVSHRRFRRAFGAPKPS